MSTVAVGRKVPSYTAASTSGRSIKSADLKGSNVVLYFYPKDDTPGCTAEGQAFRDQHAAFRKLNTVILGVSRDSPAAHDKFKAKHCFPFELLSDVDERLCSMFGVIKERTMYGRRVRGIERSTFLIDAGGVLRREWRKVKVDGHVEEVLAAAREL
ncbi:MAG: putative peroxiredoxin bcp [Gammaproteobacteria bacterium]|nr:putative peroxiredoxin bcp [Gammaproteobacteria bacterium]